jgi:hypothetical protein
METEENQPKWSRNVGGRRRSIVSYVKSPLGFYVLALLIVETFLTFAGALFGLSEPVRIAAMTTGVLLFIGLIAVVTVLVVKYPTSLVFTEHSHLEWQSMQIYGDNLHPSQGRYIDPRAGTEPTDKSSGQLAAQTNKDSAPQEGGE